VINYIRNQENHHRRKPFQKEYLEFLGRHEIPYDERYISSQLHEARLRTCRSEGAWRGLERSL